MLEVEVNGTRLAYIEQGKGEAVVFVHGGINDFRAWRDQMDVFGVEMRAVALSCRHYHPNEVVPDGAVLSLDTLAEDVAAFLHALDLAPAHLVGSSSGAFVCLLVARRWPERVLSLVLAEPPVLPVLGVNVPPGPIDLLKLLVRSPAAAMEVVKFGATGIGPAMRAFARGDDEKGVWTFIRAAVGREAAANLAPVTRQQLYDNVGTFKAQLRAGFPPFGASDARSIDVPTLFVTGEHSNPVHHRITDVLERLMPVAERVDIRQASHLMYTDRADVFNDAVLAFLRRRGSAARASA